MTAIGVTLLHNHFPVYEGEVLVEECDGDVKKHRTTRRTPCRSDCFV